ncbi:MAG: peptidylprolyl isomerase [Limnobacter sp.]|nr:peptidylprolyl isomerase [Limnobacter sp.]
MLKPPHIFFGFVVVAAAIGLLEWHSPQIEDSNTIEITESHREFIRQQVELAGYNAAMQNWIEEEMLYREGLKLGLDKDDLIVKRRVVQKMRFLLEGMTPIQEPTAEQLQAWLDKNPQKFQTGQSIQFEHYFFSRGKRGDQALFDARDMLVQLRKPSSAKGALASDPFPLNTKQHPLPLDQVVRDLGGDLSKRIDALPVGEWSEPMNSALGVHLVKVTHKVNGRTMTVQEAGAALKTDLLAAQRATLNEASSAALLSTYKVELK